MKSIGSWERAHRGQAPRDPVCCGMLRLGEGGTSAPRLLGPLSSAPGWCGLGSSTETQPWVSFRAQASHGRHLQGLGHLLEAPFSCAAVWHSPAAPCVLRRRPCQEAACEAADPAQSAVALVHRMDVINCSPAPGDRGPGALPAPLAVPPLLHAPPTPACCHSAVALCRSRAHQDREEGLSVRGTRQRRSQHPGGPRVV